MKELKEQIKFVLELNSATWDDLTDIIEVQKKDDWVSVVDVALKYKRSYRTIRRWIDKYHLTYRKIAGKEIKIKLSEVESKVAKYNNSDSI